MLAWVMNLGFAASPAGTPPVSSGAPQQGLVIGIGILVRSLLILALLTGAFHAS